MLMVERAISMIRSIPAIMAIPCDEDEASFVQKLRG
jgi:hypothetical protein